MAMIMIPSGSSLFVGCSCFIFFFYSFCIAIWSAWFGDLFLFRLVYTHSFYDNDLALLFFVLFLEFQLRKKYNDTPFVRGQLDHVRFSTTHPCAAFVIHGA